MSLVNVAAVSANPTPDRQISIQSVAGSIIYTVPAGRIFRGVAASNTTVTFTVSGSGPLIAGTTDGGFPLTLLAGSFITFNNSSGSLVGIESDA